MLQKIILQGFLFLLPCFLFSQNVGIGTTTPNVKAALEIKSTDKGVLFPRLTSAQRNAISNAPDGLHIYNTDEHCLNFYDSSFQTWNCYCENDTCKIVTIKISGGSSVDFYNTYAIHFPTSRKYVLLIDIGITLFTAGGVDALNFSTLPSANPIAIKIINRGSILGAGGSGGNGSTGQPGSCFRSATAGNPGGAAITTRPGVTISIDNYGLIAAGGGGGGGGGGTTNGQYGGGGGGGAGTNPGNGGMGGGNTFSGPFGSCGTITSIAQGGTAGQAASGGAGGTGSNGGNGGIGGGRGLQGQNGTGTNPGIGGLAGKAISGGSGNSIINIGGQSFGVVD